MTLKRTALYDEHVKLGGRMVDFGGWEMPVQYTGVMDEHNTCRTAAGLFDVSHMGEFEVDGRDAEAFLNYLVTNDVRKIADGQAQYTVMCLDCGGIVDDLIIYKKSADRFFIVVNASNTEKDFAHFQAVAGRFMLGKGRLSIRNSSHRYSQIAVQGPKAVAIVQSLTDLPLAPIKTYHFAEGTLRDGPACLFARTGYTGEDGFELYVDWDYGPELWRALLVSGKPYGMKPVGLGARDTLRLESKYPLYGHELTDKTNPLEAALGWVVKLDKGDFVGRGVIQSVKEVGLKRKLVGLKLLERGVPRQSYPVWNADHQKRIGEITSGTQSPSLQTPIGIAYVEVPFADVGSRVCVEIRGDFLSAEIVPTPFYKRSY